MREMAKVARVTDRRDRWKKGHNCSAWEEEREREQAKRERERERGRETEKEKNSKVERRLSERSTFATDFGVKSEQQVACGLKLGANDYRASVQCHTHKVSNWPVAKHQISSNVSRTTANKTNREQMCNANRLARRPNSTSKLARLKAHQKPNQVE
jgi:hypothetical protein